MPRIDSTGAALAMAVVLSGCTTPQVAPELPPYAFQGLRSVVYHVSDLALATDWYSRVLEVQPYYREAWYAGFSVQGFELGLDPDLALVSPPGDGAVAYWQVADAEMAFERLVGLGAEPVSGLQEVGGDIRLAILRDPFGNLLGIIQTPPP